MERCSNCGGTLKLSADRKKQVCEYCDSEFYISKPDTRKADAGQSKVCLALQLLDVSAVENFDNNHNKTSFTNMCALLNADYTVGACLEKLRKLAVNHTDWAMEDINTDLLYKAKKQLDNVISADERLLFFKDSALIPAGKSGVIITDKNIISFKKKKMHRLAICDIRSFYMLPLLLGNGEWYFNENKELTVDCIACSAEEQGFIMALICLLVKEYNQYSYKIKVYRGSF